MQNAGLDESQAGIKTARRHSNSKLILSWHALSEHGAVNVCAYICVHMTCVYTSVCVCHFCLEIKKLGIEDVILGEGNKA